MATLDMLKKLLEEFREKESLVHEEIEVIYDEIAQLESKLETCKSRLSTLGGDHDKILAMRQRYVENRFERVYSTPGNGQPIAPAAKPAQTAAASSPRQSTIPSAPGQAGNTRQTTSAQQGAADKPSVPDFFKPSAPPTKATEPNTPTPAQQDEPSNPFQPEQAKPIQTASAPSGNAPTAPVMQPQAQASGSADLATAADPGAPPKATLKPGQGVRKNKSALSAILGPLRTAASQLTSNQTPPAPWENDEAPSTPEQQAPAPGPSISQTGSYYPGVNVAITDTPPTQELPKPGMLTGNPANDEPQQQHQEHEEKGTTAEPEKSKAEDDSDAMKSINDALRSLFR
ncbi:MAG TPA: hypothetical protein V6D22_19740 [Candidatus Obscuribacterales bacterium]